MKHLFSSVLFMAIFTSLACNAPTFSQPAPPTQASGPSSAPPAGNPTPIPAASIKGFVWHDLCSLPTLGPLPSPLPTGCIPSGDTAEANGIRETGEPGIPGVQVNLYKGGCNGSILTNKLTANDGSYSFESINEAGTFCITVNPVAPPNDSILIPGGWTYPSKGASTAQTIIQISPGQSYQIDFGWDFQFLP